METDKTLTNKTLSDRLAHAAVDRGKIIIGLVAVFWAVEIIDTIALSNRLEAQGIQPRSLRGLDGILWSPFLHGGFGHLIANTIPFIMLAAFTLVLGVRRFVQGSLIIIVVGGFAVWLLAIGSNENHVGASGWIFGLFGLLVANGVFERKVRSIALALVALALYGTSFAFGLVPTPGRSWEGHLFGLLAGVFAGWLLTRRSEAPAVETTSL